MPILLNRVDERLIHGQVVIGWGNQLRLDRYIIVDDALAGSDWEMDLYRLGAGSAEVLFADVEGARERIGEWRGEPERSILLTRDIGTMRRLAEGGLLAGEQVNLGGIHHGPGRRELLTYLHLSEEDRRDLAAIATSGAVVTARDLPDTHRVTLDSLLKG
jgi:PTS system mannose-specific IIB component/fructoselysine and glucoselysine-specific PTS system IIB component